MTQWAVIVDPNSAGHSGNTASVSGSVKFIDDDPANYPGEASNTWTASFPVTDLADPESIVTHIVDAVLAVGPVTVMNNQAHPGTRFFDALDAAHVSFLPPYLPDVDPAPVAPIPAGAIVLWPEFTAIPSGWTHHTGLSKLEDKYDIVTIQKS